MFSISNVLLSICLHCCYLLSFLPGFAGPDPQHNEEQAGDAEPCQPPPPEVVTKCRGNYQNWLIPDHILEVEWPPPICAANKAQRTNKAAQMKLSESPHNNRSFLRGQQAGTGTFLPAYKIQYNERARERMRLAVWHAGTSLAVAAVGGRKMNTLSH